MTVAGFLTELTNLRNSVRFFQPCSPSCPWERLLSLARDGERDTHLFTSRPHRAEACANSPGARNRAIRAQQRFEKSMPKWLRRKVHSLGADTKFNRHLRISEQTHKGCTNCSRQDDTLTPLQVTNSLRRNLFTRVSRRNVTREARKALARFCSEK
jgi:hypothetical protein